MSCKLFACYFGANGGLANTEHGLRLKLYLCVCCDAWSHYVDVSAAWIHLLLSHQASNSSNLSRGTSNDVLKKKEEELNKREVEIATMKRKLVEEEQRKIEVAKRQRQDAEDAARENQRLIIKAEADKEKERLRVEMARLRQEKADQEKELLRMQEKKKFEAEEEEQRKIEVAKGQRQDAEDAARENQRLIVQAEADKEKERLRVESERLRQEKADKEKERLRVELERLRQEKADQQKELLRMQEKQKFEAEKEEQRKIEAAKRQLQDAEDAAREEQRRIIQAEADEESERLRAELEQLRQEKVHQQKELLLMQEKVKVVAEQRAPRASAWPAGIQAEMLRQREVEIEAEMRSLQAMMHSYEAEVLHEQQLGLQKECEDIENKRRRVDLPSHQEPSKKDVEPVCQKGIDYDAQPLSAGGLVGGSASGSANGSASPSAGPEVQAGKSLCLQTANSTTHYAEYRRFVTKCKAKVRKDSQMAKCFAQGGAAAHAAFVAFLEVRTHDNMLKLQNFVVC